LISISKNIVMKIINC